MRVRQRDISLQWSDWSTPQAFSVNDNSALSGNLLQNPGAENGTTAWQHAAGGLIESLSSGQCDSVPPNSGNQFFVVGGVCSGESSSGQAYQTVDVSLYTADISYGSVEAHFSGVMRNWSGSDKPEIELVFRDNSGTELGRSARISNTTSTWTEKLGTVAVPASTRYVDFVLYGKRAWGTDNDSYFDDLQLWLVKNAMPSNLLQNPGAEDGTTAWSVLQGCLEVSPTDCDMGVPAHDSSNLFAVGGVCSGESAVGAAYQAVDVSAYASAIDAQSKKAHFGSMLRDWNGNDIPEIELVFRDIDFQIINFRVRQRIMLLQGMLSVKLFT